MQQQPMAHQAVMPTMSAPAAPRAPMSSQPGMPAAGSPLNEFAPRPQRAPQHAPNAPMYQPQQGQLDAQGRHVPAPAPQAASSREEDQVEIPAFLRRQAR